MNNRGRLLALLAFAVAALVAGQAVRETVNVGLISVFLQVRGSDGRPIPDLKPSDLALAVDGKEIPIDGLDRTAGSISSPRPPAVVPSTSTAAPRTSSPPPTAPELALPTSALHIAILVDETATNSFDRRDVYRQIESFLHGKTAAGAHVMLERFDGRLHTECPWTTEKEKLLAAAARMSKHLFDSRVPSPSALAEEARVHSSGRDLALQIDYFARRSLNGVYEALLLFPPVRGRKGLVLVSDGTTLLSPFDLSLLLSGANASARDQASLRAQGAERNGDVGTARMIQAALNDEALNSFTEVGGAEQGVWARRLAYVVNKAVELDIALYPVDSEAIDRGTNPGTGSKWPGRSMPGVSGRSAVPVGNSGMTSRVPVTQSMGAIAETTGGEAILLPQKLADRLAGVVASREFDYVLSFRDPFPGDNKFHKIDVAVRRSGVNLSYRHGYRVRSEEEEALDAVVAGLQEPRADNPLQATVSFEILRKEGGKDIVRMRLAYPMPPEAAGSEVQERDIHVWAVCTDDDGNRGTPVSRADKTRRGSGEKGPAYLSDGIDMALPAGQYTWSVAVKDTPSGLTSYLVLKKLL